MANEPDQTHMTDYIGVPLEELPLDNPPRQYKDIGPSWGLPCGETLFTAPDLVLETPGLLDLWKTLVPAAHENPLVEVDGNTIRRVMDGDEVNRQIRVKRDQYLRARKYFHRVINREHEGDVWKHNASDYLTRENIEWDAEWVKENYPD